MNDNIHYLYKVGAFSGSEGEWKCNDCARHLIIAHMHPYEAVNLDWGDLNAEHRFAATWDELEDMTLRWED